MLSTFDYLEMARECLNEAQATQDAHRKKCLESIAKLYTQTALAMESVGTQDNAAATTPDPVASSGGA